MHFGSAIRHLQVNDRLSPRARAELEALATEGGAAYESFATRARGRASQTFAQGLDRAAGGHGVRQRGRIDLPRNKNVARGQGRRQGSPEAEADVLAVENLDGVTRGAVAQSAFDELVLPGVEKLANVRHLQGERV